MSYFLRILLLLALLVNTSSSAVNADDLSLGENGACAISNDKLTCWGGAEASGSKSNFPGKEQNPKLVSVGSFVGCLVSGEDDKLSCWSWLDYFKIGQLPSNLTGVKKIKMYAQTLYGMFDSEIEVIDVMQNTIDHFPVPNITDFDVGQYGVCASSDGKIKCNKALNFPGNPSLPQPTIKFSRVSIEADLSFCVFSDQDYECWLEDNAKWTKFTSDPTIARPIYDIKFSPLNGYRIVVSHKGGVTEVPLKQTSIPSSPSVLLGFEDSIRRLATGGDSTLCGQTSSGNTECIGSWRLNTLGLVPATASIYEDSLLFQCAPDGFEVEAFLDPIESNMCSARLVIRDPHSWNIVENRAIECVRDQTGRVNFSQNISIPLLGNNYFDIPAEKDGRTSFYGSRPTYAYTDVVQCLTNYGGH